MAIHFKEMEDHGKACVNNITNNFTNDPEPSSSSQTFLEWAGFKAKNPGDVQISVVYHLGFITMSTATVALTRYMRFKGFLQGQYRRHTYFVFPRITRPEAELNMQNCFMFLVNFTFYKFGVEICFVAMAILAGFRWDGYSLFYLTWLAALFAAKRSYLKIIWNFLLYSAFASVTIQYIMRLNFPPPFCIEFPWYTDRTWRILQDWLCLPDQHYQHTVWPLFCEVILLLLLSRQKVAFSIEDKYGSDYPGGSNDPPSEDTENPQFENPVPDFIMFVRSWLDVVLQVVFGNVFWAALIVVFLAGSSQANAFSVGYLVLCFVMFWRGEDFFLRSSVTMRRHWNILLGYNVAVMFTKVLAQLLVNVLVTRADVAACLALRVLSATPWSTPGGPAHATLAVRGVDCHVGAPTIFWDVAAFAFLIFARRLFMSYHFVHIINDTKATAMLSSRGAELLDQIILRDIASQEEKESAIIRELVHKMDALRMKQFKLRQNPIFVSAESHYDAIRVGDYFMFDEEEIFEEDQKRLAKEAAAAKQSVPSIIEWQFANDAEKDDSEPPRRIVTIFEFLEESRKRGHMRRAVRLMEESKRKVQEGEEKNRKEENERNDGKPKEVDRNHKVSRKKKFSLLSHMKITVLWVYYFIDATFMTLAMTLYKATSNYRHILGELSKEKKELLMTGSLKGYRVAPHEPWTPNLEGYRATERKFAGTDERKFLKSQRHSTFFALMTSIYYVIAAYSENVCYFFIILHQMFEPTLISLTMTLAMFFWGTLRSPRPSTTFWVVLIAYLELTVVLEMAVRFRVGPGAWVGEALSPPSRWLWRHLRLLVWAREGAPDAYPLRLRLLLLVAILLHRIRLKKFGLWEVPRKDEENEASNVKTYQTLSLRLSPPDAYIQHLSSTPLSFTKSTSFFKEECEDSFKYFPTVLILIFTKYRQIVEIFFKHLLTSPTRVKTDVYSWLFFLDALCFVIIPLGITHFSVMQRSWFWYFEKNRFPWALFSLLLGQFTMLVIERIIYVRKSIIAKLIFHIMYLLIVHVFLFVYLPISARRRVNESPILQFFYFIKCVYFLLSAYQIRCGYAVYEHGYLFRKKYGIFYWYFHIGYMWAPFLVELRNVIDWLSTDTSFTLMEWFKLEDCFHSVYDVKCRRAFERACGVARGRGRRKALGPLAMGAFLLLLFILLLWFPLVLFRLRQELGRPARPRAVALRLHAGAFPPLYQARAYSARQFTDDEWKTLNTLYSLNHRALESLQYFHAPDLTVARLPLTSTIWDISDETRNLLLNELVNGETVTLRMVWEVEYDLLQTIRGYTTRSLARGDAVRAGLAAAVNASPTSPAPPVGVGDVLPKFLDCARLLRSEGDFGDVIATDAFLTESDSAFRKVYLQLHEEKGPAPAAAGNPPRWKMAEECSGSDWQKYLSKLPESDCASITVYVFSERQFAFFLDIMSSVTSKALYYGIVFGVWRILRSIARDTTQKIAITEMAYPDRLLELCHDIYAVRIAKNFDLEEDLFAKLIFLLRSPETLVMYTRKPYTLRPPAPRFPDKKDS